jgi:ribosomal protein L24E
MPDTLTCEYCGRPVSREQALIETVDDAWTHYFCSEACKIACGEQGPLEADDEG